MRMQNKLTVIFELWHTPNQIKSVDEVINLSPVIHCMHCTCKRDVTALMGAD